MFDSFEEITDLDYLITDSISTFYTYGDMIKPYILSNWEGQTYKAMKKRYHGMILYNKKPKFATDKPFPFGY